MSDTRKFWFDSPIAFGLSGAIVVLAFTVLVTCWTNAYFDGHSKLPAQPVDDDYWRGYAQGLEKKLEAK